MDQPEAGVPGRTEARHKILRHGRGARVGVSKLAAVIDALEEQLARPPVSDPVIDRGLARGRSTGVVSFGAFQMNYRSS